MGKLTTTNHLCHLSDENQVNHKLNAPYLNSVIVPGFDKVSSNFIINGRDHPGENAPLTSDGDRKDAVSWIKEKLKLDNADTNDAIAVFICGDRDTGKFKLAEKVMSNVPKKVQWKTINVNTPDPNSAEGRLESYNDADFVSVLRLEILKKLEKKGQENRENKVDKEDQQKIENDQYWQKRLSQSLDAEKNVLIFIDNVSSAEVLQKILPKKLSKEKRIRLLLTIWDENVISAVDGTAFKREIYFIRPLSYTDALALFRKRNMLPTDRVNTHTVRKIIKICKGYRKQIKCLRDYLVKYYKDDEAFSRLSEWIKMKEPSYSELKRYFICEEKFLHLSYITRNAILDLCLFYSDWDWDEAACILDNDVLEKLKELDLLKRESKKVSVRDDVMTYCLSRARGSRITNVNDLHAALAKDKFHEIQGIFLLQNKIPFPLSSEQLDKMENLRVLALGDWTIVEGKCKTKFSHLRYFQAGSRVEKLPVDISMLDNLRFLDNNSHQSMGLTQENASPSLKLVKSKDLGFEHYVNLSKLPHGGELVELRIEGIEQDRLPKELCEFCALKKIKLTKCKNLSSLPKSFVRLRSLKILDLSHCAKLCALPSDFGWLSSLEKVNFSYCRALKDLPETMGLLSSVMEIDLSYCKKIEQLPKSLVKLSTLRVLKLRACAHLLELPEGFEELALQKLYLEACKRLKTLPKRVGQQPLEQKTVSLSWCLSVEEIPKGFISFIKEHVEHLNLVDCIGLEALPDEFPVELSRLRNLNLSGCRSLLRLPKRFHQLQNLEKLNLSSCEKLEESSIKLSRLPCLKEVSLSNCEGLKGSCLTSLTKIQSLTFVDIHNSPNLVDRWNQMKRDNKNCHFTVATERHGLDSRSFFHSLKMDSRADKELTQVSRIDKELKVGTSEFFRGKWFFVDANGQAFYPSSLEPGTTLAVILDRDPKKEEVKAMRQILDDLQTTSTFFQIIQIGTFVSAFQKELAGRHCVCTTDNYEAHVFFKKALSTVDSFDEKVEYAMIICDVQMSHEGQFFSAWRSITTENLKDITVAVPKAEFLQLKELADTPQHSNSRTLRALLLTSEIKFLITSRNQMDIKELKGKVVFLLLSWLHKFEEERPTFKCVYDKLKELHKESMFDFEVVWIPIVVHGRVTRADHARAVKEMPWPCIADPWSINPSAMQLFRIHPSFNKLPVLLAVYPNGQLHFENLISNEGEEVIEAPCQFEEEEVIRNLKEKIAKNCMEVTENKERKNQPKQERLKLEEEITKKEKELVTKTLAQFIKDGHKKEQLD